VSILDLVELQGDLLLGIQSLAKGEPANIILTILDEPLRGVWEEDHESSLEEGEDRWDPKEPPPAPLLLADHEIDKKGEKDPNYSEELIG
jgi:hypothetical protein